MNKVTAFFKLKMRSYGYKNIDVINLKATYSIETIKNETIHVNLFGDTRDVVMFSAIEMSEQDKKALDAEFPKWPVHFERVISRFILFGPEWEGDNRIQRYSDNEFKQCNLCGAVGGTLSPNGAHYLCEARKNTGQPTPSLDDMKPTQVLGVNAFIGKDGMYHIDSETGKRVKA